MGRPNAIDPMLLYFTSGTTAKPKLVLHSHQSYPVGSLSSLFVIGVQPGDVHLNIASPGWAKHAWSNFFIPWNAGRHVFVVNQPRFNARGMLDAIAANGVTTLCAPPTVWRMFVQENLRTWKTSLREVVSAGEPLNPEVIEQVQAAWGLTNPRRLRPDRNHVPGRQLAGQKVKPGSMGRPAPGYRIRLLDVDDRDAEEGEVCIALDPPPTRPDARLPERGRQL